MKRLQVSKLLAVAHSLMHVKPQTLKNVTPTSSITYRHFACNHNSHDHTHSHNGNSQSHDHSHSECCKEKHPSNNDINSCKHDHNHTHTHEHNHHHNHEDCGSHCTGKSSATKCEINGDCKQASIQAGSEIPAECWHCGKFMDNQELFCTEPTCGRVQPIQTKKLNLFNVFDIPQSYFINDKQLELSYKELQKKLHPDKFATKSMDEKNVSTTSSSAINFAYQTLKDPVDRAQYLIWLSFERKIFEDSQTIEDPEFMMEIFDLREEIQENKRIPERKEKLIKYIQKSIAFIERAFEKSLQSKQSEDAFHNAMKLKYYYKMLEELNE